MATTMKSIDLVYFNAGGGHRSAAVALDTAIRELALPWAVRLVNLFEVLDPRDVFGKTTGMKPEQYYNARLARGWTLGLGQELKVLQALIRLSHKSLTAQLQRHWQKTEPDMVVSLVPNFNRAMYQALGLARPNAPYVTILTDFADSPPHFWIEPHQAQHLICGTAKAVAQARAAGYDEDRIHATSGMIIRPDFYRDLPIDRRAERCKLQLDPDRPTGIVMFGGHGSKVMRRIAKRLDDTQLILVCGHNSALADELREMSSGAPRAVIGFSSQIRYFMQLSDFFIGKPGPGSISEAIQQRLPVILVRNAWTMLQERYNTDWVQEHGAGIVLDSFSDIAAGVAAVTSRLDAYRARVARIQNRAIFEIPTILEGILRLSDADSGKHRYHPAFPFRPVPASGPGSIRAAAERTGMAPLRKDVLGSAIRRRARRNHRG
jgi:Glycosyltransferase family 28 C-terminal domain/Monogalactosyldiacylglycerol (MGDG) synthase